MRGFVSVYLAATCASVNYDVSFFGVGHHLDGLHRCAALAGAVTGVDIDVKRPQTVWTVVARRVSKGLYLLAAVSANKTVIIF